MPGSTALWSPPSTDRRTHAKMSRYMARMLVLAFVLGGVFVVLLMLAIF